MRIFLAQINPIVGDISGNLQKILAFIEDAKRQKIDLVVFPEMALIGYPPEDFLLLKHFIDDVEVALDTIVINSQGLSIIVGTLRRHHKKCDKPLANTAAIISNGKLVGYQDKVLLPTYDVFDERRFFEPGGKTQLWNLCGHRVAVTICEDIWRQEKYCYARDPIAELAEMHPEVAINLSGSPFSLKHGDDRLLACQRVALALHCPVLLCNQVGGNDSLIFDGHSFYLDKEGTLLACAKGFEEDVVIVDLKAKQPLSIKTDFGSTSNLYKALVLGVRDYFRKSGFTKACLGLSGGVDSALVACIAVEALGRDNVLGLLMPSRYSSEGSVSDALQLARALGMKTESIPIEGAFQQFLDLLSKPFAGRPTDVTEENLQARIRGILLMAFSNKFGYIVLSTGNKSELAMGYSTLYGDMCGGLAVISDLTKQQVYELSRWLNRDQEVIPWTTIDKPPSAELRPNQKDSDSLPDYSIVDQVVQSYIEEGQSPEEIAKRYGYSLVIVNDLVKRIHHNEYKRRQSPPGLRVSEKAFSVGRRFPIVQKYI